MSVFQLQSTYELELSTVLSTNYKAFHLSELALPFLISAYSLLDYLLKHLKLSLQLYAYVCVFCMHLCKRKGLQYHVFTHLLHSFSP